MNVLKETPEEEKKGPASRKLRRLHEFDFRLTPENIQRLIPFVLYVSIWAIIYIANHHYGEKTLSQTDKVRREVKDLKADYYTMNMRLSNKSTQSEVYKAAAPTGLKELTTPPQRIKLIQDER